MAGIEDAIKAIIGEFPIQSFWATVSEIDEDAETCTVVSVRSKLETYDVLLAITKESGIVSIPVIGSKVIVGIIENQNTSAFIVFCEKVKEYKIRAKDSVTILGDNFGGLVKIEELKTQLDKNNQLLSSLLSIINGAQIPEPGNGSPSALQIALNAVTVGKSIADFSNIENDKIKHGG